MTGLDAFLFSLSTSRTCSQNRRLVDFLFANEKLFAKSASYAVSHIGRGTGEMISDLDGSFGSRYFRRVANERT